MSRSRSFLDLLYAGAGREAYDELLTQVEARGTSGAELDALREQQRVALTLREQFVRQRQREAEMTALYETAMDLTAIRDVDEILAAIARRARSLLHADMTYLSLNDEEEGVSYMRVTDGALTPEFRSLRLPLGTGLLGLVAQTGEPYYTDDYQADERFVHRDYIDHAVAGERIRAILGVPLVVDGTVIGALLAVHRTVRQFPPAEVSLLTSFAAHAAVALENARLFERTQEALAELDAANRQIRAHSEAVETAASAHDRLTDTLVRGGGVPDVAAVVSEVLRVSTAVFDAEGRELAAAGDPFDAPEGLERAVAESAASGRSVEVEGPTSTRWYVAAALAGAERLGTLVLRRDGPALDRAARRTVERAALVIALVLLFSRSVAEAEDRVRGELLADLLSGRDADPTRLVERARRQHADLERPTVVAVAAVEGLERSRAAVVAARLAGELRGLGGQYDGQVVVVVPGRDAVDLGTALQTRLAGAGAGPTVGVAVAGPGPRAVAAAYREAASCLRTLLVLGRRGEVSDPAGLGLARLVLGDNGPDELEAFVRATIGPVLDYDARRGTNLVETMEAWFSCGGRPAEAAKRLMIHPNTVAQRLDRVGRLLGSGWRDSSRALDLQMALRLHRLRGT
jgi:hypothetical protein